MLNEALQGRTFPCDDDDVKATANQLLHNQRTFLIEHLKIKSCNAS